MLHRTRVLAVIAAGAVTITGVAGLAGAKGGVKPDQGGVRTALNLIGGEEPSVPGSALPAAADARFTGKVSKLNISGLDAARFPLTVRNQANATVSPCTVTMVLGSVINTTTTLVVDPAQGKANAASASSNAQAFPGDKASIDVVCDWTDRKGVVNHHETHWGGTL